MHVLLIAGMMLAAGPEPAKGLRAPAGFEVTEFSGSDLANDITCMTIDTKGRIVVAGKGYIRTLIDDKNSGRATKAIDFTRHVNDQAMGLLWEKEQAFAVVDGGLWRFKIAKDGVTADGAPELIRKLRTTGEHHAHAVRRGPDGWLYLIGGDSTGFDQSFATLPTSPIREPVGGCIVRFSPDLKQSEIVADGFRNCYSFDFDLNGSIWTYDSDNERCVSLPWQEGTRLYHVVPGGHHGWRAPQRSDTWRCPPYFVDVAPPVADLGRGSPTGVVCYRHLAFPRQSRGIFAADWTFGKIWRYDWFLEKPEIFVESTGDNGFAPTALAVHPKTGDLYVSIGGRGTRGAVYRIHWPNSDQIDLADWELRTDTVFDPVTRELKKKLKPPYELPFRMEYGPEWKGEYAQQLPRLLKIAGPEFDRAGALVQLRRHAQRFSADVLSQVIVEYWNRENHVVMKATADLIAALPWWRRTLLAQQARTPPEWITFGFGMLAADPKVARHIGQNLIELENANKRIADPGVRFKPEWLLNACRLIQLSLGDLTAPKVKSTVWAGYSPALPLPPERFPTLRQALREAFPTGRHDLDRELSRTLAMLEDDDPDLLHKVVKQIDRRSDPVDDIHFLIVLSRLRGPRDAETTQATVSALLELSEKFRRLKRNRDRNWSLRIAEMHAELARKDPKLNAAILTDAEFGRGDHVLFTRCPGFDRKAAAEHFLKQSQRDAWFGWNAEAVRLIGELPPAESLPALRDVWARGGFEEAILPILARAADPADAEKLLTGLTSPRLDLVRLCLDALAKIPYHKSGPAAFALVRGLRLLSDGKEAEALRERFAELLERQSDKKFGVDKEKWARWLISAYPDLAKKLAGSDGVDLSAWRKRLASINWTNGDSNRGRTVFARASCAACHSGGQAMGPDLSGVAGRFSRADLFAAILQPSKDISPRYRTTQIETKDGRLYQGLIVYEAVDGLILQTGPAETVRLPGNKIESSRLTAISMMPLGLLDRLTDAEIADLNAYLKSLSKRE